MRGKYKTNHDSEEDTIENLRERKAKGGVKQHETNYESGGSNSEYCESESEKSMSTKDVGFRRIIQFHE